MSTRFFLRMCGAIGILVSVIAVGGISAGDSAGSPGSTGEFVYVVDDLSDGVSQFGVGATGALSPLSPPAVSTFSDNSFNVAVTPDGATAYVTNGIDSTVSQYTINPTDGMLSPMSPPTVATGHDDYDVTVSPDGKSVYVTNAIDNTVSQYNIDSVTGGLSPKVPAAVPTGPGPQGIVVTPDGKNAYVTNAGGGPGTTFTVSQYMIDPLTGKLSPMTPATVATGDNPEHVAVTPDGKSAYVTDSDAATVSQYNIDPATGALSPKTPATVTAGTPGFGDISGVVVTPNGKSVYVANSDNTIWQYDVDPISGALSPKSSPSVPAGTLPVDIAVTSDGKSAYVTNAVSNDVSQFSIDPISGALSPKAPSSVAAGVDPLGIAVRSVTKAPTATQLASSPDPARVGKRVTYTATVGVDSPGTGTPTGTVNFSDNAVPISGCGAVPLAAGQATCTVAYSTTGSHGIVAIYSGDANFLASTSPELGEAVMRCLLGAFGCDLVGANLVNSDMAGQVFAGTDLAQSDLAGADLKGTVFFLTSMEQANLSGADLADAKLLFVDLAQANLTNADLSGSTLFGVNVSGVTWSNTICPDATNSNADGGTCARHL